MVGRLGWVVDEFHLQGIDTEEIIATVHAGAPR
jgi:hypothetical protein